MVISSLIEFCARIGIEFSRPEFLVIDASDAEFNAAQACFGSDCKVLMCWFHVMKNIKKPDVRKLIPSQHYETVLNDIRYLHMSLSREYPRRKEEILKKWDTFNMPLFVEYFSKQWLEGFNY